MGVHLQAPLLHTPAQGSGWGFTRGPGQPRRQRPPVHLSSQHTTAEGRQRQEGLPRAPVVPAALLPEPTCDAGHTSPLPALLLDPPAGPAASYCSFSGRACQSPAVSAELTESVRGFCSHGRWQRCAHVCDAAIYSHFYHLGIFLPSDRHTTQSKGTIKTPKHTPPAKNKFTDHQVPRTPREF